MDGDVMRPSASGAGHAVLDSGAAKATETEPAAGRGLVAFSDRKIIALLWLVLLAQGVVFAFLQPAWSRVDEAQHFHYVQYLVENRSLPVEGQAFISPQVVDVSLKSGQWGWRPAGSVSTPVYIDPSAWTTVPPELDDQEREKWVRRNLWRFNYEAMQPPLYYLVNVPAYAALPDDPFIRLYGMRLLAALLASAMVPLAYLTAREAFPDSRLVVLGVPVGVILTQGYALNMSQITNDALAIPLAAAAVLLLLRMMGRGLSLSRSVAAGAVIGASLLAKMTTIFLLPVALAALVVLVAYRRERLSRALGHAGLMFVSAALMLSPWLIHNISVYGDSTGASAAQPLMSSFFMSPFVSLDNLRLGELLPTYWFGEPVFPFAFWPYAWLALFAAMATAVVGLLYYFLGQGPGQVRDVRVRVVFLLIAFGLGVGVNLLLPFGSGIGGVPGRYLYPVMPTGLFLILFGIDRLLRRGRARFMAEALLVWMVVWESVNFLAYIQNR